MRCQLAADLFQYASRRGVEVKDRKGTTFRLDLEGIANGAIVPCLTPHTERRRRAAFDQRLEKPLLVEDVPSRVLQQFGYCLGNRESPRLRARAYRRM